MPEIPLTQGKVAIVDEEDFEWLSKFKWCVFIIRHKGTPTGKYYACRTLRINGRMTTVLMHREILKEVKEIDHRDCDGLNNRRSNLRPASDFQNACNRSKQEGTSSRFKGVAWNKRKRNWEAYIKVNRKKQYLGNFGDEIDAALAYNKAAIQLFGEFANVNVIAKQLTIDLFGARA